jgi:hypothetical protein
MITPLKAGALTKDTARETLSRFEEDIWDMEPAIFHVTARNAFRTVDFSGIACPGEKLMAKEYIFAWLNERLPDGGARLRPVSAHSALMELMRFVTFTREKLGRFHVSLIDQELIDVWLGFQKRRKITAGRVGALMRPVVELHRLAPFLTCGGLNFIPWNGRTIFSVAGCTGGRHENVTPRIPEPVIGALLRWSLKYVETFAADIFAARAELDALERRYAERAARAPTGSRTVKMQTWIDERRRGGRGIPAWNDSSVQRGVLSALSRSSSPNGDVLNMRLIALQSGIEYKNMRQDSVAMRLLNDAVEELGCERGGMDTVISCDPDTGHPWRERFDALSLTREECHLQTAAYVVCAYLTGMRDSEVQAMQPGSLGRKLNADGLVERVAIRSMTYKGRGTRGEAEEWITIEPVAKAIDVAERLAERHRERRREDGIWFMLDRDAAREKGLPRIVRRINLLRDHLDERYGFRDESAIPYVDGQKWAFNTRQLRRTVAWYIANRPFGVIAGKIQYKHASVAMFDGYAGTSASGFRQEVEQEHALGQLDDIVEHYEARQRGERLTGPAANRVAAEMDRVAREVGGFPGIIADRGRVRAMLGHLARTFHVGYLNDCFFEPATALCRAQSQRTQKATPMLSNCAPDRCPNSCITARHLPAWEESIAEADELMRNKRLSPLQREALQRDNARKRKLIAPLKEQGS